MTATYRIHGISDDTDTCEVCGKTELKSVVMLLALDADGNAEEMIYAGSTCAARKLKASGTQTTAPRIRDAAAGAGRVWTRAREWAAEMGGITFNEYLKANWTAAQNLGVQHMRNSFDATMAEIGIIESGTLTGTRWEQKLPTV